MRRGARVMIIAAADDARRSREEGRLGQIAQNVLDAEERLLDPLGVAAGNDDRAVHQRDERSALTEESQGPHLHPPGGLDRPDHVFGVPAGADTDEDISRLAVRLKLPLEHALEARVVGVGGQDRRVGGQRQSRQGGPLAMRMKAADELGRHVLAIRGASAVAAQEDLVAAPERGDEHLRGLKDPLRRLPGQTLVERGAFAQLAGDALQSIAGRRGAHDRSPPRAAGATVPRELARSEAMRSAAAARSAARWSATTTGSQAASFPYPVSTRIVVAPARCPSS